MAEKRKSYGLRWAVLEGGWVVDVGGWGWSKAEARAILGQDARLIRVEILAAPKRKAVKS